MSEKKYSKEHEWITLEGDIGTVGITKHAAEMLGDVVFIELPEKGKKVEKDSQIGVVESTKAASDVYTPVSGEITEGNQSIVDDPSTVNKDPEGSAWFFKIKIKNKNDLDALMKQSDYDKFVKESAS
tara:strand:- start:320 stop:700 length:381 start_codon:yes stop_codon:yes gene_type:complete